MEVFVYGEKENGKDNNNDKRQSENHSQSLKRVQPKNDPRQTTKFLASYIVDNSPTSMYY